MTDAYRNVVFGGKMGHEIEGKLLFDTGATTNLIAINHPILNFAEQIKGKSLKKWQKRTDYQYYTLIQANMQKL